MGGLGLRKLEEMNKACLLKLGWKLQTSSDEYWSHVLKGKYDDNSRTVGSYRTTDSSLWKSLVKLNPILEQFSYWCVGDGRLIEAWIEEGLVIDQVVSIPQHLRGLKICDLVDNAGNWNWELFSSWMSDVLQQKIAAILPPMNEYGKDERIGVGGSKNSFSVASMYNNICGFHHMDDIPMWSLIWKLQVPERVRTFIWMVSHDRLLTSSLKCSMGLGHAMCKFCGDIPETTLHVLRDCPLAMEIWGNLISVNSRSRFMDEDLHAWISFNLKNSISWNSLGDWCDVWAVSCHSLWYWRNKEAHDVSFVRPNRPVQQVMKLVGAYMNVLKNDKVIVEQSRTMAMIRWNPPQTNFVRLNTDSAYKVNQAAGCGGVIRGCDGEWLGGFAKGVGLCSAFVAELWGVLVGLKFVRRLGFLKVELHIDSKAVVQVVETRKLRSSLGVALAKQIWHLLDMDWCVEISHSYREANKCADALANIGCSLNHEILVFDDCPSHIRDIYRDDRMGVSILRMIPL
jgi:ribonuclease HI